MTHPWHPFDAQSLAIQIDAEIRASPLQNTPHVRAIRRRYSQVLRTAPAAFVFELATALLEKFGQRWVAYELIRAHPGALALVGEAELEALGQGIDSWGAVDSFARTLAGPAWLRGQVTEELIHCWAASPDRWWRRAALVSTVALNLRSQGGPGDAPRTLAVCRRLAADPDDMVVKALSWALRELVPHDPEAVQAFVQEHQSVLAARVQREVRNKLKTGLKNPRP
jgi:3-methyladenine DNA glycosylase AlkD